MSHILENPRVFHHVTQDDPPKRNCVPDHVTFGLVVSPLRFWEGFSRPWLSHLCRVRLALCEPHEFFRGLCSVIAASQLA